MRPHRLWRVSCAWAVPKQVLAPPTEKNKRSSGAKQSVRTACREKQAQQRCQNKCSHRLQRKTSAAAVQNKASVPLAEKNKRSSGAKTSARTAYREKQAQQRCKTKRPYRLQKKTFAAAVRMPVILQN
ncbi:hypothetical protein D6856_07970 [Butyrivibrio sp. XB500-5]|nr:hypothetical protein D6856_07970 [Butyrivibrio sp. XB500-5]